MKSLTYRDFSLVLVRQTERPGFLLSMACNTTLKQDAGNFIVEPASQKLIKFLLNADHMSMFEHMSMTFLLSNASRSFLAQITRHRMASYTSSSQHYQDYSDYPVIASPLVNKEEAYKKAIKVTYDVYKELLSLGHKPEEARQVLPGAKAINLIITINARSLINFLVQRLCQRNVAETINAANCIRNAAIHWWPQVFELIGPPCKMYGFCTQGHMQAESCKSFIKAKPRFII